MGGSSTDFASSDKYDFTDTPTVTKKTARDYAKADKREYVAPAKGLPPPVGKNIEASSSLVMAVLLDQTGSMKKIPGQFIEKAPTWYAEANAAIQGKSLKQLEKGAKLEDLLEIAVVAIGDRRSPMQKENYPLQVLDYCNGAKLVKGVLEIFPEGLGGGNCKESYDLGAYFLLNHSSTPKVPKGAKPVLIIAGDEGFYDTIRASEVKQLIGDDLPKDLKTEDVLVKLKEKFDTYVLRPEVSQYDPEQYAAVQRQWEGIFGAERVLRMNTYERMVDCIIGVAGYASDNFKVSEELLRRRQTPTQVDEVLSILHPLLAAKRTPTKKARKK